MNNPIIEIIEVIDVVMNNDCQYCAGRPIC